jgi:hypothetical protein
MWGFLSLTVLFLAFILLVLKLLPPYLEDAKVATAVENVAKQPGSAGLGRKEIEQAIERRFEIDDVTRVNLAEHLSIERGEKGQGNVIRIQYEVVVPLVYNMSALLQFDHSAVAGGAAP